MGNRILVVMDKQEMTQYRLAKLMGKTPSYINKLVKRPSLNDTRYGTLKQVADILGVDVVELEATNEAQ